MTKEIIARNETCLYIDTELFDNTGSIEIQIQKYLEINVPFFDFIDGIDPGKSKTENCCYPLIIFSGDFFPKGFEDFISLLLATRKNIKIVTAYSNLQIGRNSINIPYAFRRKKIVQSTKSYFPIDILEGNNSEFASESMSDSHFDPETKTDSLYTELEDINIKIPKTYLAEIYNHHSPINDVITIINEFLKLKCDEYVDCICFRLGIDCNSAQDSVNHFRESFYITIDTLCKKKLLNHGRFVLPDKIRDDKVVIPNIKKYGLSTKIVVSTLFKIGLWKNGKIQFVNNYLIAKHYFDKYEKTDEAKKLMEDICFNVYKAKRFSNLHRYAKVDLDEIGVKVFITLLYKNKYNEKNFDFLCKSYQFYKGSSNNPEKLEESFNTLLEHLRQLTNF